MLFSSLQWSLPHGRGLGSSARFERSKEQAGRQTSFTQCGYAACSYHSAKAAGQAAFSDPQGGVDQDAQKYRNVKLFFPSGDPSQPPTKRTYRSLSRRDLMAGAQSMGDTVVPLQQLRGAGQLSEDFELTPLSEVQLEEGGEYLVLTSSSPLSLSGQLQELQGWQRNTARSHEDEDAERAVLWLRANGQPDARRVCTKRLEAGGIAVKLGGLIVSSEYVVLVESKETIDYPHPVELVNKLNSFRMILALEGVVDRYPQLSGLVDKHPLLVLSGRALTQDPARQRGIRRACAESKVEVWLPQSSGGLGPHSSCFESPYLHFAL